MKKLLLLSAMMVLLRYTAVNADTYYVDGELGATCTGGVGTSYRVAERDCLGADTTVIGWKSIYEANTNISAGETVYIRGGTEDYQVYAVGAIDGSTATRGIDPDNNGTSWTNRITYSVYPGEKVHFQGNDPYAYTWGIALKDNNYIHVTGIDPSDSTAKNMKFSNLWQGLYITSATDLPGDPETDGSHYNEIDHCEFTEQSNTEGTGLYNYRYNSISRHSTYNWVHDCAFHSWGYHSGPYTSSECDGPADPWSCCVAEGSGNCSRDNGVGLDIGTEAWRGSSTSSDADDKPDYTNFNLVEDCDLYHCGHQNVGVFGKHNMVRNCHIYNDPWYYNSDLDKTFGYRSVYMVGDGDPAYFGPSQDTWYDTNNHNFLEGNRIAHSGITSWSTNAGGVALCMVAQKESLLRYNEFYAAGLSALYINTKPSQYGWNLHIYNNTVFACGNGEALTNANSTFRSGFVQFDSVVKLLINNFHVFKNNIFWKNRYGMVYDGDSITLEPAGQGLTQTRENNWEEEDEGTDDPLFINEGPYSSPTMDDPYFITAGADASSTSVPNLGLQSGSPCINAGGALTVTTNSGSASTTLTVDDALYFQDAYFGESGDDVSAFLTAANWEADWIAIGTVGNIVQISAINYTTDTITLASAKTWANGASVWLYKKSDGTVVLYGSAPDQGAHESNHGGPTISGGIILGGTIQ